MSIEDLIKFHCGNGLLFGVSSIVPSDSIERLLFVSDDINRKLIGPWDSAAEESKWNKARVVMDVFTSGGLLSVGTGRSRYHMTHLEPHNAGVWDMRSHNTRVIGMFAEKNMFIGLNYEHRSDLISRLQWNRATNRSKAIWRSLFHSYQPILSDDSNDYITKIISH